MGRLSVEEATILLKYCGSPPTTWSLKDIPPGVEDMAWAKRQLLLAPLTLQILLSWAGLYEERKQRFTAKIRVILGFIVDWIITHEFESKFRYFLGLNSDNSPILYAVYEKLRRPVRVRVLLYSMAAMTSANNLLPSYQSPI